MINENVLRHNLRAGVKNSTREMRVLAERLTSFADYMEHTGAPVHGEAVERDIMQPAMREVVRLTRLWEQYQWLEA